MKVAAAVLIGLALLLAPPKGGAQSVPRPGALTTDEHGDLRMPNTTHGPVVVLGASYAGGWQLPTIAGRTVVNKGVQGEQSWEMLARFDRDVIALRPSAVILWGCINDIFRSPREQVDVALSKARDSFEQMSARARAAGIEVIVATEVSIRPRDEWGEVLASWIGWAMGKESYQTYINGRVAEMNSWLRDLARRERLLLLDLQPVVSDESGQRRKAFAKEDGSHITPLGYEAITAYTTPLLEKHFRATVSQGSR